MKYWKNIVDNYIDKITNLSITELEIEVRNLFSLMNHDKFWKHYYNAGASQMNDAKKYLLTSVREKLWSWPRHKIKPEKWKQVEIKEFKGTHLSKFIDRRKFLLGNFPDVDKNSNIYKVLQKLSATENQNIVLKVVDINIDLHKMHIEEILQAKKNDNYYTKLYFTNIDESNFREFENVYRRLFSNLWDDEIVKVLLRSVFTNYHLELGKGKDYYYHLLISDEVEQNSPAIRFVLRGFNIAVLVPDNIQNREAFQNHEFSRVRINNLKTNNIQLNLIKEERKCSSSKQKNDSPQSASETDIFTLKFWKQKYEKIKRKVKAFIEEE